MGASGNLRALTDQQSGAFLFRQVSQNKDRLMIIQGVQVMCLAFHYMSRVTSSITIRKYKQNRFSLSSALQLQFKESKECLLQSKCICYSLFQSGSVCSLKALQTNRKHLNQPFYDQQVRIPDFLHCMFYPLRYKVGKVYFSQSHIC